MRAARYLLGRLVTGIVGLLVFSSIMYLAFTWLVPGDFSSNFAQGTSAAEMARIRAELGLDLPWYEQYFAFMGSILRLEFGRAYFGPPVREVLIEVMPWTLTLFLLAMTIALVIGLPLGRRAGWGDHRLSPTLVAAATATSIFPPWLALIIANVGFGLVGATMYDRLRNLDELIWDTGPTHFVVLWWLVAGVLAATSLSVVLRRHAGLARHRWLRIAAIPLSLALLGVALGLTGLAPKTIDLLGHLTMPVLAFALTMTGEVILVVAAAMAGTQSAPYTHAARAKGLTEGAIRSRHAGRATLLPAISRMAASLPYALGGLMIIEAAFAQIGARGIGLIGVSSAIISFGFQQRNTPLVVGAVVAIGLVAMILRLVVDVLHVVLDPRIDVELAIA